MNNQIYITYNIMGCADIYCFICGNPCHSFNDYHKKMIDSYLNSSRTYPLMIRKLVNNLKDDVYLEEKMDNLEKYTRWANKCSMLMVDDRVIHGLTETICYNEFSKKNITVKHFGYDLLDMNWGIFLHTDCWKYIKDTYKVSLKFSDLPPFSKSRDFNKNFDINYGDIESYWRQDFRFGHIMVDNKLFLCSSPLKKDKNIKQIKQNIANLGIRNVVGRKGPNISATYFVDGDVKIGNNDKFWYIGNGKWNELKEDVIKIKLTVDVSKLSRKQNKWLWHMSYTSQHNNKPVFILDVQLKKRNIFDVTFLCTESFVDKLFKMLSIDK